MGRVEWFEPHFTYFIFFLIACIYFISLLVLLKLCARPIGRSLVVNIFLCEIVPWVAKYLIKFKALNHQSNGSGTRDMIVNTHGKST